MENEPSNAPGEPRRPSLIGHVRIARIDHWVKNVFVLPGVVAAIALAPSSISNPLLIVQNLVLGLIAVCLVASSNYVINEVLDAPYDRTHPTKCARPVPAGQVSIPLAYVQWLALMVIGLAIAWLISLPLAITLAFLWVMGCIYNIPPVRTKDLPYLDVLSEAVNNPLRMLAGWYIVNPDAMTPASLLISYWMVGCYFMALKRFAEYRHIANAPRAALYRKSFALYTEQSLLVSVMFYASSAMLFFGAFIMRYRLEMVLAFPLVAHVMAAYLSLSFKHESAVQAPEKLYREPALVISVIVCTLVMIALLFVDLPWMYDVFSPTAPTGIETVPDQVVVPRK